MLRPGTPVREKITVSGLDSGVVAALIVKLAAGASVSALSTGPATYVLTRRARPTWALVLGCLSAPTLLGIALFFVRVTQRCTVDVTRASSGRGCVVQLTGHLPATLLDQIHAALGEARLAPPTFAPGVIPTAPPMLAAAPGPEAGVGPATVAPPVVEGSFAASRAMRGSTFAPAVATPAPALITSAISRPTHRLAFDTGVTCRVTELLLVGRDPTAGPGEDGAALMAVPDYSVSRTHLAVGVDEHGLWVRDQGSSNGTSVRGLDGAERACPAMAVVYLGVGDTVVFGDRAFTVQQDADRG